MLEYLCLLLVLLILVVIVKWVFSPYFNWRHQKQIAKAKSDDAIVLFQNREYKYNEFKNPSKNLELSIIIPAYNEEARLGRTLEATMKYFSKYRHEIIIVNDCSSDDTYAIVLLDRIGVAKKYANETIKIVAYTVNKGKGGAVRMGMLIAQGEVQLMMDADLATDITEFEKLNSELTRIQRNGLGLVAGSRNHLAEKVTVQRKWYRNILMHCCNFVINTICGVQIKDTQCGFKLFTKNTAGILFRVQHLERWAFDVELFMIAKYYKVPVAELPVNWVDVEGSHLNVVEASITMSRDFLMVRLLYLLRIWKYNDDIGL